MNLSIHWSTMLRTIGYTAMLVGAIDPMEGSFIILPGSGLVLLGTYFSNFQRQIIFYRLWVFILVTAGVAAEEQYDTENIQTTAKETDKQVTGMLATTSSIDSMYLLVLIIGIVILLTTLYYWFKK